MNICVAGWYLNSEIYDTLKNVDNVYIVSHNPDIKRLYQIGLPYSIVGNIGLEFHCYNYYLNRHWNGGDTLFMHDDVQIPIELFRCISVLNVDQAYLFNNYEDERRNGGKSGRAIFMSERLQKHMKMNNGGFWYDAANEGYTGNGKPRPNPTMDFNSGINTFHKTMGRIRDNKELDFNVVNRIYFNEMFLARRGKYVS
jgi:hypothetical protein